MQGKEKRRCRHQLGELLGQNDLKTRSSKYETNPNSGNLLFKRRCELLDGRDSSFTESAYQPTVNKHMHTISYESS